MQATIKQNKVKNTGFSIDPGLSLMFRQNITATEGAVLSAEVEQGPIAGKQCCRSGIVSLPERSNTSAIPLFSSISHVGRKLWQTSVHIYIISFMFHHRDSLQMLDAWILFSPCYTGKWVLPSSLSFSLLCHIWTVFIFLWPLALSIFKIFAYLLEFSLLGITVILHRILERM